MQIIVLGMHRSGTSALTRILSFMGAHLGSEGEMMSPNSANPTGFWERSDVVELNDRILDSLDVQWNTAINFDVDRIGPRHRENLAAELRELTLSLDRHRPWVIKDPRLCLTLPFWRPSLDRPVIVLVHRPPVEVAKSLRVRDRLPVPLGVALWEQHTLLALRHTRDLPRFFVHHKDLMAEPLATARSIFDQLSSLGAVGLEPAPERRILSFIDPSLIHQKGTSALESAYLNEARKGLLDSILDGSVLAKESVPTLSPDSRDLIAAHLELRTVAKSLDAGAQDDLRVVLEAGEDDPPPRTIDLRFADRVTDLRNEQRELSTEIDDLSAEVDSLEAQARRMRSRHSRLSEPSGEGISRGTDRT